MSPAFSFVARYLPASTPPLKLFVATTAVLPFHEGMSLSIRTTLTPAFRALLRAGTTAALVGVIAMPFTPCATMFWIAAISPASSVPLLPWREDHRRAWGSRVPLLRGVLEREEEVDGELGDEAELHGGRLLAWSASPRRSRRAPRSRRGRSQRPRPRTACSSTSCVLSSGKQDWHRYVESALTSSPLPCSSCGSAGRVAPRRAKRGKRPRIRSLTTSHDQRDDLRVGLRGRDRALRPSARVGARRRGRRPPSRDPSRARPRSRPGCSFRSRRIRSSTRRDSRTPSAAVGSSRITTFAANAAARLTATACRCPPDISPTVVVEVGQRHLQPFEHLAGRLRHPLSLEEPERPRQPDRPGELAAGVEVVGGPEVVEEREVLVDGLDAECARIGRRVDRDRHAVHLDRPAVEPVDAAQALDQGRLARAVVAEKREHLAVVDVERDAVERDDGAEALVGVR